MSEGKPYRTSLVWFRGDLRSHDHAALSRALGSSERVCCAFVFETDILDRLPDERDRRMDFIWHSMVELRDPLAEMGGRPRRPSWPGSGEARRSRRFFPAYDAIPWPSRDGQFQAGCEGRTGYPIVEHSVARKRALERLQSAR
jgi:deoxyribodipyrimidine photolyase